MKALLDVVRRIAYGLYLVAGVLLLVMVATVLYEIVSRSLFGISRGAIDITIRGGVEIVSYALLFMVLFALPYAVDRGQVVVDLFTESMGRHLAGLFAGVYTLGFALLGFGMSLRFYEGVGRLAMTGETTQDLLIPMTHIYAVASLATFLLGLRSLLIGIHEIRKGALRL